MVGGGVRATGAASLGVGIMVLVTIGKYARPGALAQHILTVGIADLGASRGAA